MYEKMTLENGVRIVSEKMSGVKSAAIGIWIGVGSRNEKSVENGAAHFIEHMLFKGTETRSAADLAGLMDGIGGHINAFTTRENTCYYARVPDYHLDTALDVLTDMFFNSNFAEEDVVSERGVILEEIGMYDDSPEEVVVERLFARAFRGPLGRSVLGTPSTLGRMTGESLRAFKESQYIGPRIVISICGNFKVSHLRRLAKSFGKLPNTKPPITREGVYTPVVMTKRKATEQNQLVIAYPGLIIADDDRFALNLLSNIFGGGMSSRLFQSIREKSGLCYSIYTFTSSFQDTGLFGIATALGRDTEFKALTLITEEIDRLLNDGVSDEELVRAREQVKASLALSMESTSSRMNRLGNSELNLGTSLSVDEIIARYDSVSGEDLLKLTRQLIDANNMSFSAVGRVSTDDEYLSILKTR